MALDVKIELVQVNFVPTWWTVDDDGKPISSKTTAIGQLSVDCSYLPEKLRRELRELTAEYFKQYMGEEDANNPARL